MRIRVFFVRSIEGMLTTTVGLSKVGWLPMNCKDSTSRVAIDV